MILFNYDLYYSTYYIVSRGGLFQTDIIYYLASPKMKKKHLRAHVLICYIIYVDKHIIIYEGILYQVKPRT